MLRSMTGFGRAEGVIKDNKVTVELRSLNSKQLDVFIKSPPRFKEKDPDLRQWAGEQVVRGKGELFIACEIAPGARRSLFNTDVVRAYHDELKRVAREVDPTAQTDLLGLVLRMPDVATADRDGPDEAEWAGVLRLADEAANAFREFREAEGRKLGIDLRHRVERIGTLLTEIDVFDGGRIERTRDRIRARLAELQAKVDQDRFEQELVFYLEKLDVNEEKVRLRAHCGYFIETMDKEEAQGRKLGFIAQEMGREINTLGAKANDAAMQRVVVLMKDELEKVKEQVLNVL